MYISFTILGQEVFSIGVALGGVEEEAVEEIEDEPPFGFALPSREDDIQ